MNFSKRIQQLKPSGTLAVSSRAAELKAQGYDIISLSLGEPDFPTPSHVAEAARDAIQAGFTRYTPVPGIPEARDAVAGYFKRFYGVEAARENTMLCNGGKQVLYNIFMAILNPGDEVLMPAPYWVSYPDMIELAQAVPVPVFVPVTEGGKLTPEHLEKRLTPRTRMLLLNSPSNPTGVCYSQSELNTLTEWAISKNLFVVSDELYDQLVYDKKLCASLSQVWQRYPEQIAIVGGLSKCFSMPGWRVGYALAHAELIRQMSKLQGQCTSNICSIAQKAAVAALLGSFASVDSMRSEYRRRRDVALAIIDQWNLVTYPKPDGAFYLFLNVSRMFDEKTPDIVSLCTWLMETAGVATVPGSAFGDPESLRISYSIEEKMLVEALNRMGRAFLNK